MSKLEFLSGFSLIELMIGLMISAMILTSVSTIYYSATKNFKYQESFNNRQDTVRTINNFLLHDFRMAGFIGCAKLTNSFPLINHSSIDFTPIHVIEKFNTDKKKANTDAVLTRRTGDVYTVLTENMENPSVMIVQPAHFQPEDWVMVSDCNHAEIFQIKHISINSFGLQRITSTVELSSLYSAGSELSRVEEHHYFVANSGRQNEKGEPIYSLYTESINNKKFEIAENISDFKVQLTQHDSSINLVNYCFLTSGDNPLPDSWWCVSAGVRS